MNKNLRSIRYWRLLLPFTFKCWLWYRGFAILKYAPTYSSRESVAVLIGFDISEYNLQVGYS